MTCRSRATLVLRQNNSPLTHSIYRAKSNKEKVRLTYLAMLNRKPTASEVAMLRKDIDRLGDAACQDLIWTLVNSHEFRFVQ